MTDASLLGILCVVNYLSEKHLLGKLVVQYLVVDKAHVWPSCRVISVDGICDVLRLEGAVQSAGLLKHRRLGIVHSLIIDLSDG